MRRRSIKTALKPFAIKDAGAVSSSFHRQLFLTRRKISQVGGNAEISGPPRHIHCRSGEREISITFFSTKRPACRKVLLSERPLHRSVCRQSGFWASRSLLKPGVRYFRWENTTVLTPNTTWETEIRFFLRAFANGTTASAVQSICLSALTFWEVNSFPGVAIGDVSSPTGQGLNIGPSNNFRQRRRVPEPTSK